MDEERVIKYITSNYAKSYRERDNAPYPIGEIMPLTADEEWYLDAYLFYWCDVLGRSL